MVLYEYTRKLQTVKDVVIALKKENGELTAEFISGDRFATGSKINAFTAHAQCADIIVMFETDNIAQTPSSLERYLVIIIIIII